MPWDSNIFVTNECRLCSEFSVLDNIITGANERCTATGTALLSTTHRLYTLYAIQAAIQAKITALIPLFVNHTLPVGSPGNYDNEATIPMWSEATMLIAIGAVSRLIPGRLFVDADWAVQQYKIINLLRSTNETQDCLLDPNALVKGRTSGATPAQAIIKWFAAPWGNQSVLVGHYFVKRSSGWVIARHSNTYQVQNTRSEIATIDAYCQFSGIGAPTPAVYENNDYVGYGEGDYLKIASGVDIAASAYITSVLMGKIETVTCTAPVTGGNGWYLGTTAQAVYKFEDYFDFKDW